MIRPRQLLAVAALVASVATGGGGAPEARAAESAWSENAESRVRLITPYRLAPREGEVWLGLHFRLIPGWHVYWRNSGDAGFPPEIRLESPPELGGARLLWPAPERYELPGELVAFGYEHEVVYPVRASLERAGRDRLEIAVAIDYLVCEVDCVPYGYVLRLDQEVADEPEPDPATAPLLETWRARLPVPVAELPGVSTAGRLDVGDGSRPVLTVAVEGARAAPGERPELFLDAHELFEPGRPELRESPSGLSFRVALEPKRSLAELPEEARFAWTVTGLALGSGRAGGGEPIALESAQNVPTTSLPGAAAEARREGPIDPATGAALAGLLLRALAGGVVQAATPGALALVLVLCGALRDATGPGRRPIAGALAAAFGALAAGLALAVADLAIPGGGWSALLQSPLAVTACALITLLFALGLWGFLGRPDTPPATVRPRPGAAFAAGVLLTVLALPWPLPPAAPAVDRASALGPWSGFAATLAVAAGLALPVLVGGFLGRAPAAPVARPAAGPRREALGFLPAASLVGLLYVLSGLLGAEELAFVELSFLGVGLGAWGRGRAAGATARRIWTGAAAIAAGAAFWLAAMG